jgi:hypothetical protein
MIIAVILHIRLVLEKSALICVGELREMSGYQKLLGLHVDKMSLSPKVEAVGEPAWTLHASTSASYPQGYHHFWADVVLSMGRLGPFRKKWVIHPPRAGE